MKRKNIFAYYKNRCTGEELSVVVDELIKKILVLKVIFFEKTFMRFGFNHKQKIEFSLRVF